MFQRLGCTTISILRRKFHFHTKSNIIRSDINTENMLKTGLPLKEVVNALEGFASTSLAGSWDNVGLLIEPSEKKTVHNILLTNDLTEDVVAEAIGSNINLIICYHPIIFAPMKRITTKTWQERVAIKCLENRIAVFSPHTSFDAVKGGVNDWLVSAFGEAVFTNVPIERDNKNPDFGMGRICSLNKTISLDEAVDLVKKHTGLNYVKLARVKPHSGDGSVNTIAVCAGSGGSVLKGVQADLYLTGEMRHSELLDAIHNGTSVILTNHSDSERGFLKVFSSILDNLLNKTVNVTVSKIDKDPLQTV